MQCGAALTNSKAKTHGGVAVDAGHPLDGADAYALSESGDNYDLLIAGDVVITFPDSLSMDSVEDLDGYWQVFIKKARREAGG